MESLANNFQDPDNDHGTVEMPPKQDPRPKVTTSLSKETEFMTVSDTAFK
jgi:hypothetical protein